MSTLLLLAACPTEPDLTAPSSVTVTATTNTLASIGETTQLTVRVLNVKGDLLPGNLAVWTTGNSAVATVSAAGLVTASGNGQAVITATASGAKGSVTLEVRQAVATLSTDVDTVRFASKGDAASIVAHATDARGNPIATPIQWTTSDPTIATVNGAGQVVSVGNGIATITGQLDANQVHVVVIVSQVVASLTVTPTLNTLESIGDTLPLSAVAKDARGNLIAGASFVWASSLPAVATVDADGKVVSRSDGLATISATNVVSAAGAAVVLPLSGHADVRVRQVAVSVTWEPLPASILEDEPLAGVRVRIADRRNNPVINATGTVGFVLTQGSVAGQLTGTTQVVPSGGFAELSAATITLSGVNYRLTANFPPLQTVITPLFTVQHRFASVVLGGAFACGRDFDGATWCWGDNTSSQLLMPAITGHADLPTRIQTLDRFSPLLPGSAAACGVDTGQVYCWANIDFPVLTQPTPIAGGTGLSPFASSGTENYGCGIRSPDIVCYGTFVNGSLTAQPIQRPPGVSYIAVGVGLAHQCGIDTARAAWCQGNNPEGQLGDGTTSFGTLSAPVAGGWLWAMIEGGVDHTCGLTTAQQLFCWGDNRSGQLGDATLGPRSLIPVQVPTPVPLALMHVGFFHGCGLGVDQQVYCWGRGENGEIGTGIANSGSHQVQRVALPGPVLDVQVGAHFSCALTARGQILCWGLNFSGQRGDGGAGDTFLPSPVGVKP